MCQPSTYPLRSSQFAVFNWDQAIDLSVQQSVPDVQNQATAAVDAAVFAPQRRESVSSFRQAIPMSLDLMTVN